MKSGSKQTRVSNPMFFLDWISCDKFSERVSRALDGELAWHEKPAYYFRLGMCMTSRRFRRQMYALEEISRKRGLVDNYADSEQSEDPTLLLGADAQVRIQEALRRELNA